MDVGVNSITNSSTNFRAIPLGQYKPFEDNIVDVYKLEKRDLPYIQGICKDIKNYFQTKSITDETTQDIMHDSFECVYKLLNSSESVSKNTDMLVGVKDKEIKGILIGNVPKRNSAGKIHYSSRNNHTKNEQELDWFVTWNSHGVGKSLICEFFKGIKQMKFKKLFVRSELPENSTAQDIYEHFGFKQISKREDWIKHSRAIPVTNKVDELTNSEIIPMIINKLNLKKTEKDLCSLCQRKDLDRQSVSFYEILQH